MKFWRVLLSIGLVYLLVRWMQSKKMTPSPASTNSLQYGQYILGYSPSNVLSAGTSQSQINASKALSTLYASVIKPTATSIITPTSVVSQITGKSAGDVAFMKQFPLGQTVYDASGRMGKLFIPGGPIIYTS